MKEFLVKILKKIQYTLALYADSLCCLIGLFRKKNNTSQYLMICKTDAIGDYLLFRNFLPYVHAHARKNNWQVVFVGNVLVKNLSEHLDSSYIDKFVWLQIPRFYKSFGYRFQKLKEIYTIPVGMVLVPMYTRLYHVDHFLKYIYARKLGMQTTSGTNISPNALQKANTFYHDLFEVCDEHTFEWYRNKSFFKKALQAEIKINDMFITDAEIEGYQNYVVDRAKYILIFPGGSVPTKRWPAAFYSELIQRIMQTYKVKVVLIGSPNEIPIGEEICAHVNPLVHLINCIGKTNLVQVLSLVQHATLMISNESSGIHMAAGFNIPAVCISHTEFLYRFSPYPKAMKKDITYLFHPDTDWTDSSKNKTLKLSEIPVSEVWNCVERKLGILLK